jgi:serine/threonine protein kinase
MEHPSRVGKYDIEEFLGGGMSHVYRARDSVLGRQVALKLLTREGVSDEEAKARFLMEARTASNINHENVIAIYDFGEDQGRPFIVMELLEGQSLRDAIRAGQVADTGQRLRAALQIARALDHIHSKKIVHRDIKPENINIDSEGKITLMDFGIAKIQGTNLTRAGFTLGTPYYMAPEQVMGQPLTAQADVYSFGILLYEMFSGRKPIDGTSIEVIFQKILNEPLDMAQLQGSGAPQGLIDLVGRCTQKQLAQRPRGLTGVSQELERLLNPSAPPAPPRIQAAPPVPQSGPPPLQSSAPELPPQQYPSFIPGALRSQGGLLFLGMLLAAAVVFAIYGVLVLAHVV